MSTTPPLPPPKLIRSDANQKNQFSPLDDIDDEKIKPSAVHPINPIHLPQIPSAERWADYVTTTPPVAIGSNGLTRLTSLDSSWKTVESRATKRRRRRALRKKKQEEEALAAASPEIPGLVDARADAVEHDPRSPTMYHHAFAYVEEQTVGAS